MVQSGVALLERQRSRAERLAGVVERVTFHNADSGWCVLRVRPHGGREALVVVGRAAAVNVGEHVEALGRWTEHPAHGPQFEAEGLRCTLPGSPVDLQGFLASGLIRGVGAASAKRLVEAFGEALPAVLEREPERLLVVPGIGPKRQQEIAAAWAEQQSLRDLAQWLHAHELPVSRASRIQARYGEAAVRLIADDPYRLARDIAGIGFRTADALAGRLGIAGHDARRLRAGVGFALADGIGDGHCALPRRPVVASGAALLGVREAAMEMAVADEVAAHRIVVEEREGEELLFLPGMFQAEVGVARRLRALAQASPGWNAVDARQTVGWLGRAHGIRLSRSQRAALDLALRSRLCIVTGGPGVGKTMLVRAILAVLETHKVKVVLSAPTGRAAKRLAESTRAEAMTLHRLLEADRGEGGFRRNALNPLCCDLLVVDEASMVDVPLMHSLLKALPEHAGLLLVGDVDQLPSVGPGQVLRDLIDSGVAPVIRLTEVFRQAEGSRIIEAASRINAGELPDLTARGEGDFFFVEARDAGDAARRAVRLAAEHIPRRFGLDPVAEVQLLCPMQRGAAGTRALNLLLQARLNPAPGAMLERQGQRFGAGDKVMHVLNDRERDLSNGDLGLVRGVEAAKLVVDFGATRHLFGGQDLDSLRLAYATTVHKAQGSEFPAVVVPLTMESQAMLGRELIYTAATRAKRLLVLVGSRRALELAVGRRQPRRWSRLKARLMGD